MVLEVHRGLLAGSPLKRTFGGVVAALLCLGGVAAFAQTGAAKPTCAAGDAVVWENTNTKVYHLAGDKYYGTTKHGAYACKSAADSAGYHLAGAKGGSKMSVATPAAMSASPAPTADATTGSSHHKHHHHSSMMASPTPSPAAT